MLAAGAGGLHPPSHGASSTPRAPRRARNARLRAHYRAALNSTGAEFDNSYAKKAPLIFKVRGAGVRAHGAERANMGSCTPRRRCVAAAAGHASARR